VRMLPRRGAFFCGAATTKSWLLSRGWPGTCHANAVSWSYTTAALVVYPRTFYTDLNSLWLLAEWHEVKG
jgi:hypothetical protein